MQEHPGEADHHVAPRRMGAEEEPEHVGAGGVAHRLDVGAGVEIVDRADRHALAVIDVAAPTHHVDEGLLVGADPPAESIRKAGQAVRAVLHGEEEFEGAEDAGRHDHPLRSVSFDPSVLLVDAGLHAVAAVPVRGQVDHLASTQNLESAAFGQVEVVVVEGVLGAVAAAEHAPSAADATRARGPLAAEVGVGHGDARGAEVDRHLRRPVAFGPSVLPGEVCEDLVGGGGEGDGGNAEHGPHPGVVGGEFGLPVREVGPRSLAEEGPLGDRVGAGVAEGAAAVPGARKDRDVPEEGHAEDPPGTQARRPEVAAQIPVRAREVLGAEPAAVFEEQDPVSLLDQAQGAHAAAEPRADDDPVEGFGGGPRGPWPGFVSGWGARQADEAYTAPPASRSAAPVDRARVRPTLEFRPAGRYGARGVHPSRPRPIVGSVWLRNGAISRIFGG